MITGVFMILCHLQGNFFFSSIYQDPDLLMLELPSNNYLISSIVPLLNHDVWLFLSINEILAGSKAYIVILQIYAKAAVNGLE
jgi:hypothetical protein